MPATRREVIWARLSWVLGVVAIVAVVGIALKRGQAQQFAHIVRTMQPAWLAAAVVMQVGTYACDAWIGCIVLGRAGCPQAFSRMFKLSIARLFVRQAVPSGGVSGDLLLVRFLGKYGVPLDATMATVIVNLFAFYAAFATCAIFAAIVFFGIDALRGPIIAVAVPFSLLVIAIPALLLWLVRSGRDLTGTRLGRVPLLGKLLSTFGVARRELLRDKHLFATATVLQIATFALDGGTLIAIVAALGQPAPAAGVFAAFVLASAAEMVGPMPGGLGAFEGGCILGLRAFDVPMGTALVATLVLRGLTFWLPMIPGVVVARWAVAPRQAGEAAAPDRSPDQARAPRREAGTPAGPPPARDERRGSSVPWIRSRIRRPES
jgi:uncharacterized protein (TIRG00374 family)